MKLIKIPLIPTIENFIGSLTTDKFSIYTYFEFI